MSEKRRDSKNRILRAGESQRKDGRYAYKYIDAFGKQQFVYAWKLVPTDKTPAGKRDDLSLREKIQEIQKDINDRINTVGKKMTVCELYAKQNQYNGNVRHSTATFRKYFMELLENDPLGAMSIDNVKMSDGKEWAIRMKEKGFAYKSISNFKRTLKATFYIAIQDDCIRKNPFDFDISTVLSDDTVKKEALTVAQEESLLGFIKTDIVYRKYYDEVIILLGTGLRISELCGLTESDIDFENRVIRVDHQLLKSRQFGYYIEKTKTKTGIREIPINDRIISAFHRVLNNRPEIKIAEIDGYKNFIFITTNGTPKTRESYIDLFSRIVAKYKQTQRIPLPQKMTAHTLRHTFCTKLANAGMNPKALQYLMGHSTINMTLNYYAHVTFESAKAEMERLAV